MPHVAKEGYLFTHFPLLILNSFVPKDHFELLSQDRNTFEYLYAQVSRLVWLLYVLEKNS